MDALEIGINQADAEEDVETDDGMPTHHVDWWDSENDDDENDELPGSVANPHLFTFPAQP